MRRVFGYYEVWQSREDALWYWHLKAPNHEIICSSQGYQSLRGAKKGMNSVRLNALMSRAKYLNA